MNWIKNKWVKSIAYWGSVLAIMLADNDLGWDDFFIFWGALIVYFKLIWQGSI